ncbi:MAG: hypothetical protein ABI193_02550 [Minicystis sp.]
MSARNQLWIVVALLSVVTACNYTVGECYPRGDADAAAVGVGPSGAGPSGGGGYGDTPPPGGGTGANACNKAEENEEEAPPDEAGLKVLCLKNDWGQPCSTRCFAKSVPCVALAVHPKKVDGGIGKLFSCNDLLVGFMCGYHYDNGDDCYYPFSSPFPTLCKYSGDGHN